MEGVVIAGALLKGDCPSTRKQKHTLASIYPSIASHSQNTYSSCPRTRSSGGSLVRRYFGGGVYVPVTSPRHAVQRPNYRAGG